MVSNLQGIPFSMRAIVIGETFNKRKIYDNVKVLKKRGKVKSIGNGIYGKA
jgi:hypothetical protein